jgi:hypothetical protein
MIFVQLKFLRMIALIFTSKLYAQTSFPAYH